MSLTTLLFAAVLPLTGLVPWWVAGRYCIPGRERLPLGDLDPQTVLVTLRRGANCFVPPRFRDAGRPLV